ncbi:HpcH/HpaI aldolase/citrate lyase family protein [Hydrogenimonas cancrithermarum]|uniref:(3S)-malyl-CoA thioesterase n=1 Tax=Hydrogenimonas cancrithermarum TaxID=2993563 RepID=A0ABN6WXI2_9BACT|nr:CoA ester lyase [Hydrogenimonas cancrithermarum]BDY13961.1 (3S)-malyl-CoA thioesterase [Hydrogenimonas cancrithermarum]
MIFENLDFLNRLVEKNDLDAIEALRKDRPQSVRYDAPFVRSALMLSAHRLRHLNKLDDLEADIVVLNLEDGVAPALKPLALRLTGLFLAEAKSIRSKTVVRINPLNGGGREEIAYLNTVLPDAIRVPKIETADDVEEALGLIDERIKVHLSIETKEGWANLSQLRVDKRVEAYYLGVLDLLASMRLPQRIVHLHNPTMHAIMTRFLLESSVAGVLPVSFVFQEYQDTEAFENWCLLENKMGYHAKGCVSPAQVEIANRVFIPSEEEIAWARRVVELFESNPNSSGFTDDELGFVDEPIYKNAKNLLELAARMG